MDPVVINVVCRRKEKKSSILSYTNYMFKGKGRSICKFVRAKDYNLMCERQEAQKKGKVSFSLFKTMNQTNIYSM